MVGYANAWLQEGRQGGEYIYAIQRRTGLVDNHIRNSMRGGILDLNLTGYTEMS